MKNAKAAVIVTLWLVLPQAGAWAQNETDNPSQPPTNINQQALANAAAQGALQSMMPGLAAANPLGMGLRAGFGAALGIAAELARQQALARQQQTQRNQPTNQNTAQTGQQTTTTSSQQTTNETPVVGNAFDASVDASGQASPASQEQLAARTGRPSGQANPSGIEATRCPVCEQAGNTVPTVGESVDVTQERAQAQGLGDKFRDRYKPPDSTILVNLPNTNISVAEAAKRLSGDLQATGAQGVRTLTGAAFVGGSYAAEQTTLGSGVPAVAANQKPDSPGLSPTARFTEFVAQLGQNAISTGLQPAYWLLKIWSDGANQVPPQRQEVVVQEDALQGTQVVVIGNPQERLAAHEGIQSHRI